MQYSVDLLSQAPVDRPKAVELLKQRRGISDVQTDTTEEKIEYCTLVHVSDKRMDSVKREAAQQQQRDFVEWSATNGQQRFQRCLSSRNF